MIFLASQQPWLCRECQHEYDRKLIEQSLVDIVHQNVLAYQLQVRFFYTRLLSRIDSLSAHLCAACSVIFFSLHW